MTLIRLKQQIPYFLCPIFNRQSKILLYSNRSIKKHDPTQGSEQLCLKTCYLLRGDLFVFLY
jgi:hypothetical protein